MRDHEPTRAPELHRFAHQREGRPSAARNSRALPRRLLRRVQWQGRHAGGLRFYGRALATVAGELWHPDQLRSEGAVPSRGRFVEILGRTLCFGVDAEALAPEGFRALWKAEILKMAALIS